MLASVLGWIGTIMILSAYLLVSNKYKDPADNFVRILNITGSTLVAIQAILLSLWNVLGLQLVWIIITIISMIKKK